MSTKKSLVYLAAVLLAACGGGSGGGSSDSGQNVIGDNPNDSPGGVSTPMAEPPVIASPASLTVEINTAINHLITVRNDVDHCEFVPVLPDGLTITTEVEGCRVTGTVSTVSTVTYVLTATNSDGSDNASWLLSVEDNSTPLSLPVIGNTPEFEVVINTDVDYLIPVSGGLTSCSFIPELPQGLLVATEETGCRVTGSAADVADKTSYALTATNSDGSDSAVWMLSVNTPDVPGPDPADFDHVAVVREGSNVGSQLAVVSDVYNVPLTPDFSNALELQLQGFGFGITEVVLFDDELAVSTLTDAGEIATLFTLQQNGANPVANLELARVMDYESNNNNNAHFYGVTVNLGNGQSETVLVRLYDVQNGDNEILTLDSANEFLSFTQGDFVADASQTKFEVINLPHNDRHNVRNYRVLLTTDLSADQLGGNAWPGFDFVGVFDGGNHVITDLELNGSSAHGGAFVTFMDPPPVETVNRVADPTMRRLGLMDLRINVIGRRNLPSVNGHSRSDQNLFRSSRQFFPGERRANFHLDRIAVSGIANLNLATNGTTQFVLLDFGGFNTDRFYSNVLYNVNGFTSGIQRISGFGNTDTRGRTKQNFYVNGAIRQTGDKPDIRARLACFDNVSSGVNLTGPAYCSMGYDVTTTQRPFDGSPTVDNMSVGFTSGTSGLPGGDRSSSSYPVRFVTDRIQTAIPRRAGVFSTDYNNDGIADGDNSYTEAGRDLDVVRNAGQWTGAWINNGAWDIADGEWPVLKNMPYPHTQGAAWMNADDPGVAYQRATYDLYIGTPTP